MSDLSSSPAPDDVYYAKLVARAEAVAQRVVRAIGVLSALEEQVLVEVFGLSRPQIAAAHAYALLGVEPDSPDIASAIDRCAENMLRAAAGLRKLNAANRQFDPRTTLLLDDLQILHREFDFLQKFLLADDPLARMARNVYQERFVAIAPGGGERLQAVDDEGAETKRGEGSSGAGPGRQPSSHAASEAGGEPPDAAAPPKVPPAKRIAAMLQPPQPPAAVAAEAEPEDDDLELILTDDEDGSVEDVTADNHRADAAGGDAEPAAEPAAAGEKITVACGHCGQRFAAPSRLLGTQARCLNCKRPLTITRSAQPAAARSAEAAGPRRTSPVAGDPPARIRIACAHCSQQFYAPADLAGRTVSCSACGKPIFVPSQQPSAAMVTAYESDPLATFDERDDFLDLAEMQPPATAYRTPAPAAYVRRPYRYRRQDDEVPRWVWYAMAAALGICAIVFLAILLITLFGRGGSPAMPASGTGSREAAVEPSPE